MGYHEGAALAAVDLVQVEHLRDADSPAQADEGPREHAYLSFEVGN